MAELGPYFALQSRDSAHPWQPLGALLEPGPLEDRVGRTARALRVPDDTAEGRRVAASTVALGLFSRLVSPVLGAVALEAAVPRISLTSTWWYPADSGPWPLAVDASTDSDAPLEAVLSQTIGPLIERFADGFALSFTVLWGNAAAAVFGAVASLHRIGADPDRRATSLAVAELDRSPLHGHGRISEGTFVRRSCCLYYRVPGGGYCGDCVLAHR